MRGEMSRLTERFRGHLEGVADIAPAAVWLCGVMLMVAPEVMASKAATPAAPDLKPDTVAAFNKYVKLTDTRNQGELQRGTNLLWIDSLSKDEQAQAYDALKRGEVKIQKLETLENAGKIRCPGGMIHHWVGVAFVPGAELQDVLGVLQDYNHHAQYYVPDVERSRIESRDGDHFVVFLRFRRHKVITVVLNTRHDVRYFRDSETRAHSRSSAVRIAEVENGDKSDEREKPPGEDGGFLWGMETWWRMEERDGGVYVQSEVASLTRDIPTGLGWLIGPFVTSIPRETLTFTLEATRKAVATTPKNKIVVVSPGHCLEAGPRLVFSPLAAAWRFFASAEIRKSHVSRALRSQV
jgi:hypothetical protein